MAVDIGPRIGIEGEAQYRKEINNIITQAKTLSSEMRTVESSFDKNTSAQEKAAKKGEVLARQIDVQKERVKLLSEMYERSKAELGENDNATLKWKQALNNANTELNKMEHELQETKESADGYGEEIKDANDAQAEFTNTTKKMEALERVSEALNKASEYAREFATTAVDAAKELDEGYDTIATKTGATGDALKELNGIANDIFGKMPVDMAEVGSAVGEVNTRFKQTGKELQSTSEDFLKFAQINDTDVSNAIDSTDRVMKIFGVDSKQTTNVLGLLTKAGQDSGIEMSRLSSALDSNGATLNELGFDLQSATSLMAAFESGGVDTSSVMTALRKSVVNAAKQGKSANSVLADASDRIKNASSDTEALQIATEIFGTRGAVVMAEGLRSGRINLNQTSKSLESYGNVVEDTFEATLDPWDESKKAMNNLKRAGSDLAGSALSTLAPAIKSISDVVSKAADGFENLPGPVKTVVGSIAGIGTVGAIVAPKVLSVVKAIEGFKIAQQVSKGFEALNAAQEAGTAITTAATAANVANTAAETAGTVAAEAHTAATVAETAAQQGLNAALLANPLTGIIAAVGTFTAALVINTNRLNNSKDTYEGLARSVEKSGKQMRELETANKDSAAEVSMLSGKVKELNEKEHLSTEEKMELAGAVARLNELMPNLNVQIDEQTGKIIGNTKAVYDNIDAAVKQYQIEKNKEELAELVKTYSENLEAEAEAEKRVQDAMAARAAEQNQSDAWFYYNDQVTEAEESLKRIQTETANEKARYEELLQGIGEGESVFQSNAEATDEAASSYDEYGNAVGAAADETETAATEIAEANQKIVESISSTVSNSISLFKEFEGGEKITTDQMLANLDSQIAGVTNWEANLGKLMEMGGSNVAGFVQMLYEQGPESANAVQALVDGGAEKLNEIATKWDESQTIANLGNKEAQAMLTSLGLIDVATDAGMAQVEGSTAQGWTGVQSAAATGAANVINAGREGLRAGGMNLNKSAYETTAGMGANMAAGERSGSKQVQGATKDIASYADVKPYANSMAGQLKTTGTYITAQFAAGIRSNSSQVFQAMKTLTTQVQGAQPGAQTAGKNVGNAVGTGLSQSVASIKMQMKNIVNAVKAGVDSVNSVGDTAYKAGKNVAGSVAKGLSDKESSVSSEAKGVANAAKGPLEGLGGQGKTWGEHLGQNFATGIANKRQAAKNEAQKTANEVAAILKHSTPKEGPLKDDDVWGEHLAENFAEGIARETPAVRAAALNMAQAAAVAANPLIDPSIVSGRSALGASITESIDLSQAGIDPDAVYEAIRSGANNIKLYIGERELGRVLRDMGVTFAA